MSSLKQLTIEHLRGCIAPFSLPFEKGKKLTVIYGENGTGKSTICDALEFLCRGKISSLENRGLGQTLRFWPSTGKSPGDISVTLETSDGSCRAAMTRTGEVAAVPTDRRPRAEIFRKTQILSLIEATPGERYAAISRFIDVSAVEASEAALRDLIRELRRSQELAIAGLTENIQTVHQFWETAGRPGKDAFAWAEEECRRGTGSATYTTGATSPPSKPSSSPKSLQATSPRLWKRLSKPLRRTPRKSLRFSKPLRRISRRSRDPKSVRFVKAKRKRRILRIESGSV